MKAQEVVLELLQVPYNKVGVAIDQQDGCGNDHQSGCGGDQQGGCGKDGWAWKKKLL